VKTKYDRAIKTLRDKIEALTTLPVVIGIGKASRKDCFIVYLQTKRRPAGIPKTWHGIPVKVERTGRIRPAKRGPACLGSRRGSRFDP